MDNFLKENNLDGFDLIKIDVEGFAYQVLVGFGDYLKNCSLIQIELEKAEVWKNQKTDNDVIKLMEDNNFLIADRNELCELQCNILFYNASLFKR
jgi:hypothetical protein